MDLWILQRVMGSERKRAMDGMEERNGPYGAAEGKKLECGKEVSAAEGGRTIHLQMHSLPFTPSLPLRPLFLPYSFAFHLPYFSCTVDDRWRGNQRQDRGPGDSEGDGGIFPGGTEVTFLITT